jgi:hypothetical protein
MADATNQVQQVQDQVASNSRQPESRRRLSTATYASNTNVAVDIPRDTSIKRINLSLNAAFTATFASGSPVLSPLGMISRVCPNFYVIADGSRNIKVLDLYMMRCLNALAYEGIPRRAYAKGAGLTTTTLTPTTEHLAGTVAYGSTTQDLIYNESVDVMFENYFAYELGRNASLLYTKNLSTCSMYFGFADISNVIDTGNTAPVFYTNVAVSISPTIIESRDAPIGSGAFDFAETVIRKQFSSQTTAFAVDLNTGNRLLGLGLMAQNGDTAKSLSDNVVTDLNLVVNGATSIQATKFKELSNDNHGRFGIDGDQYASSVRALQGFAYMNLMQGGNLLSGLDTRLQAGVSQVQLLVSTQGTTGVDPATYTNPVQLSVLQQLLIPVPPKS